VTEPAGEKWHGEAVTGEVPAVKTEKLTHFEGKKSFSSAQPKRQTKNAALRADR
jgi:hypothetical protein